MNKLKLRKKGCFFIALGLIASMIVAVSYSGKVNSSANFEGKNTAKARLLAKREVVNETLNFNRSANENEVVRAIVTLKADSVVEKDEEAIEYTSKEKSEEKKILKEQNSLVKQAEKITGKKVENQSAYLVNSFSIDSTRKQMKQLAKIKGVESVYEASTYKAYMNTATKEGNAVAEWNDEKYGYTGEGVVVAVLDSGVNYKHQDMVLDSGVKTKFTKEQWEEKIKLLGYGEYFTEKVPFGYNYCTGEDSCLIRAVEGGYHGYHVSGIIAGNNKDIQGVAKNAQVIGLKVLNDRGSGTTDDIIKGIEDAVKLDADVINMSLGKSGAVVSDEDAIQSAIKNASKEGVICCIAVGNEGTSSSRGQDTNLMNMKDTAMAGTPAVTKSCLAVASADNTIFRNAIIVNATVDKAEVTFNATDVIGRGFDMTDVKLVDVGVGVKDDKLTVNVDDIKGNIAVVTEGDSTFNEKVYYLSEVGAKGIIIVSNNEKINANIDVYPWNSVSAIVVSKTDGKSIIAAAKKQQTFTTKSITDNGETQRNITMSSFTSWGPTNELDIKPEISAPGGNIKAAYDGTDNYFVLSGTSMATPFIAGSEAIMLDALKARGISLEGEDLSKFMKNSLMNTADAIVDERTGNYYSVRQQGSGMVDVYGAVDNDVLVTYNGEAKVELGEITSSKEIELTFTNYGKEDRSYTASDVQIYADYTMNEKVSDNEIKGVYGLKPVQGAEVVFSNNNIVVPAGNSVTVKGTVNLTNNYEKDSYVEAFIRFKGNNNAQDIGVPVLGFYGDFDKEPIVDRSVYDKGKSFVSSKLPGVDSCTSLAEMEDYMASGILGEEIIKDKTGQSQNRTLSKEDISELKNSPTIKSIIDKKKPDKEKAIPVKVGDITGVTLINNDSYVLYELSADEDTGCFVNVPKEIKPIVSIYNSKMEAIDSNYFKLPFGYDNLDEFSLQSGAKCYIEIASLEGKSGKYDVSFEKKDYVEETDITSRVKGTEEPSEVEEEVIELGKANDISLSSGMCYVAEYTAQNDGYVTFNVDMDGFINYAIYEYEKNVISSNPRSNLIRIERNTTEGKFSREIKVKAGVTYKMEIMSENSIDTCTDLSQESKILGTLSLQESDGSNYYVLKTLYNGDKVAFSPNGDGTRDMVGPSVTQLRNAKEMTVKVLDSNKNVIRIIGKVNDTHRATYGAIDVGGYTDGICNSHGNVVGSCVAWDGTVYDKATGEFITVEVGQYYIQVESKRTANSEPEVITMPVKVDVTKPEIGECDIKKENGNTVLYMQPSDDLALSEHYYLDIETTIDECTYPTTIDRNYITTNKDEQGRYVVNLGKLEKVSKVTLMIDDVAGNCTFKDIIGKSNPENNEESDEEFEDELDDNYGHDGDMVKGPVIEMLDTDLFTEVKKAGLSKTIVLAENLTYPCSFKVKATSEDLAPDTAGIFEYNIEDYVHNENPADILFYGKLRNRTKMDKMIKDIDDVEKADLESDEISSNVSYKYEGNGIFTITLENKTKGIIGFEIADSSSNVESHRIYLCEDRARFNTAINYSAYDVTLNLKDDIITKETLNEDGTLNVSGELGIMPDSLKVNGINTEVDEKTLKFSTNISIRRGENRIVVDQTINGKSVKVGQKLYYNEMKVEFINLPKADNNGVVNVNSDEFKLYGIVNSCISIGNITINGDEVYTSLETKSYTEENPLIKNFDYNVSLQKGINVITVVVKDTLGNVEKVQLKVNYK